MISAGLARLADVLITMALAGFERGPIVEHVRKREEEGATPDEISDELEAMRKQSEADTQARIDQARAEGR